MMRTADLSPKPVPLDRPLESTRGMSVEDLQQFAMLKGVSAEELTPILNAAKVLNIKKGEALIEKGAANSTMYMLMEGELSVHLDTVDGEIVAILGSGQTVGELSVLDKSPASAFVLGATDARLLVVDESLLWKLIQSSHAAAVNLLMQLTARLRANNELVHTSATARKQLERVAMFDGLTGVHNRRWLDQTLDRLVQRFDRAGEPLSLVVSDVDHFKSFNDTYGHHAGDEVLVAVAKALAEGMRPTDLLARFGGEEFVLILPNTDIQGAQVCAERLRLKVADTEVMHPDGTGLLPKITISLGVAELTVDMTAKELFTRADAALYRAKKSGRNRVELADSKSTSNAA